MHPLLPLILLAGVGVQAIWLRPAAAGAARRASRSPRSRSSTSALASFRVNALHGADPRELLVSTQSSDRGQAGRRPGARARRERGPGKPPLTVTVDAADGATFPYAWYFRHLDAGYIDLSAPGTLPAHGTSLILTDAARDAPARAARRLRRPPVRVPRLVGARLLASSTPGSAWRWLSARTPGTPRGGMPEWLEWPRSLGTDAAPLSSQTVVPPRVEHARGRAGPTSRARRSP